MRNIDSCETLKIINALTFILPEIKDKREEQNIEMRFSYYEVQLVKSCFT